MINLNLQQRLQQKLSPQQLQVIKLLEIPTIELEERIHEELEENPALEEGSETEERQDDEADFDENPNESNSDDLDLGDYMHDDDIPEYKLKTNNSSPDDRREDIPFSAGTTFREHLIEQLQLYENLSEQEIKLAEYIIGNIDDEGYLRRDIELITDDVAFQLGIEVSDEQMLQLLQLVQSFEPAGVGARNLRECLLLQLDRKTPSESIALARIILTDFYDEFTKKHYEKIIKKLGTDETLFKKALAEITRLNPKPGNAWGNMLEQNNSVVVPDFILERVGGEPVVVLNNGSVPELRVSRVYREMFADYSKNKQNREIKDTVQFVKQKLDAARGFIDAIKQRNETLLRTATAIVQLQREFFEEGDETLLHPMILKDVAEITGLELSTVSRACSGKYIQTDFGIFSLKFFFSESLQTETGEDVSSREIKSILRSCIEKEDKRHPITDEQLTEVLKQKGYIIARRTVAKYRDLLEIPIARLRKTL
ncbi:MAG: RNA polymerase factor sigma-54 [Prevotellaceae bacterium]|jgi:RNA polymerase sigma-54 factor|nr:RNA polymerase factor sigma-54 [Prevotellaceae bacterium]